MTLFTCFYLIPFNIAFNNELILEIKYFYTLVIIILTINAIVKLNTIHYSKGIIIN